MEFVEFLPILHIQLYVETELAHLNHYSPNDPRHLLCNNQVQTYHHHLSESSSSPIMGHNYSDPDHPLTTGCDHHHESSSDTHQLLLDPDPAAHELLDQLPLRLPVWAVIFLTVVYCITFFLGVAGNCAVIFVVTRLRRMKTVTNYFVVSLAIADNLVLLFCLLPNLISNIFVPWVLGPFLCKFVPYIQGASVCSSIYFLVAISVERCIAIEWPFKYQITKEKAKLIIFGIWLWSAIIALPWALFFTSGPFDEENPHLEFCIEIWPDSLQDWQTYYFIIGNLFTCFLFPLLLILLCYLTIWFRVYRRPVPSDCYYKAIELMHQKSKTAVLKMVIVVVLVFAISWFPLYAIIIRVKFGPEAMTELEASVISFVYPIAQWLLCFNSSVNSYIYYINSSKFRKAFTGIIWGTSQRRKNRVMIKHKSPTVNILLKRFNTYRVETTMSRTKDNEDSSDSM